MAGTPEKEFKRLAERFGETDVRLLAGIQRAFQKDGFRWKASAKQRVQGKPSLDGPSKSKTLASRRGNTGLAGGFYFETTGERLDDITLYKGNNRRHAVTHEFGATIKPKKAKFLTVPLRDAMTPGGVPREARARDWPDTFVFKSDSGKLFIAQGEGDDMTLLYLLLKRVKIPARLGMRKIHEDQANDRLNDIRTEVTRAFSNG